MGILSMESKRWILLTVLAFISGLWLISCNSGGGSEEIRPYDDSGSDNSEGDDDDVSVNDSPPSVGTGVGDIVPDFIYTNQNGSKTTLWDSKGEVILLACAATWCPACQGDTPRLETDFYSEYKSKGQGFTVHQLLAEDDYGSAPSEQVLSDWAEAFQLTFPVLADPGWSFCGEMLVDSYIPTYILVDQELVIRKKDLMLGAFHSGIRELLGID